ncbi:MAG: aspartate aminotransferase family protein [Rhodospirillaceae bacterium]
MTTSAVMPNYARYDLEFESGEGVWLTAVDGRRFLDFGAGVAVNALGHAHPHLVQALQDQAGRLWHTSNLYRIPGQTRLAERLVANSFADQAFFCNSGAEAVEACIKMARRYHAEVLGTPERNRVIATQDAFHGRTIATISAGGQAKNTVGFAPLLDGFDRVPFGNLNEARAAVTAESAAILVEPIQGEGGINLPPEGYLAGLRAMADEFGLVLIYDEVQTGIGRTGSLFGYQMAGGAAPDVMALAKGLGGGFPVGACLATAEVARAFGPGSHGSTFGGNPLAMAAANAVLDVVLEEEFLTGVSSRGAVLLQALQHLADAHPTQIAEVRGEGMMIGIKIADPLTNGAVVGAFQAQGLLCVPAANNVVRLLPPLITTEDEIAIALTMMGAAFDGLAAEAA